jgi:error-prone DNA polymerase
VSYAALWCKSNGSFLEGASHPEELVEEAHRQGLAAIAITDRDGVYGVVRAFEKARELGVRVLYGAQVTIEKESPIGEPSGARRGAPRRASPGEDARSIVLIAEERAGWASLCRLLTVGRLRSEKGESEVTLREVCEHASGLVALARGELDELREAFGDRLYALAARHHLAEEVDEERALRERARRCDVRIAAAVEVLYHTPARRKLQDVLTCIRHGVTIHGAGRLIRGNAEHDLKSPYAFRTLFSDDPAAIAHTLEIAERCHFTLADLRYRYPSERLPDGKSSSEWLRDLTLAGARERYGELVPDDVIAQLNKELTLINELDYCGYFLTMREIIEFCRREDILCQGRGSAANSAVCYCLGITAVDPVRMKLLFERFLSRERAEPPDIDLDIEHERREEVIQHVYKRYGRDKAAMVANVIRYRARSAIRDVGKVLGLSETALDRVAGLLSHHDTLDGTLALAGLDGATVAHAQLLELANEILNFPRHLGIHPGGFLLGHEPVPTLVPIENATMEERTVIQWDKDDVEAVGLFKVDLLGLGALTHLHKTFDLLAARDVKLSMATIPEGDAATYERICAGDTIGVFQIESRAQMAMLPRLKPKNYYDLVIEVSIVRPGPITGGMVHPYLRRRNQDEIVDYPHPSLIPVLQKTLGVPLFQEQVMQLAIVAADYTPGEADQLRRDMAAWRRTGRIEQHREKLVSRMLTKGIAPEFAERVFKQICGFGEYGFPESHAASFALVAYAGAYLKRHFPSEFTCALLNAQPMGFYTPSTIIEDAKRHGVVVLPIDICESAWDCRIVGEASGASRGAPRRAEPGEDARSIDGDSVRIGLRYVKGLGERDWPKIAAAAPFSSVEDFVRRAPLGEKALVALAEAGAFERFVPRRDALWQVRGLMRARPTPLPVEAEAPVAFTSLTPLETINWDYRRTRSSARGHPLGPLREALRAQGLPDALEVAQMPNGRRLRYAGLVICRQHPGTASGVTFMTLEDESGLVNVVVWKKVFDQFAVLLRTRSFLGVTGKLQVEGGVRHLIAESLWSPLLDEKPESGGSRDFH